MQPLAEVTPRKSVTWIYGLAAGLALSICSFVFYKQGPVVYMSNQSFIRWLLLIGFGVASALHAKHLNGGWLSMRDATRACFLVFVMGFAVDTLFIWVLLNFIDPGFKLQAVQAGVTRAHDFYLNHGVSEADTEKALEAQKGSDPFALGSLTMGLALYYILFFIFALIIAVIVKKKPKPGTAAASGGL